jgi:D-3-phosphoglycerate dehydrogenase
LKLEARVLVCDPLDIEGIEKMKSAGLKVDVKSSISIDELKRTVSNYDALIVRGRTNVTQEVLEAATHLKLVGRAGVGLDNIDLESADRRGVKVVSTPEAPAEAVAELTIGLILSLARGISGADCAMKEGRWIKNELIGWEIKGKTLGTIGLGNVGKRVAMLARALSAKILITKRTRPNSDLLDKLEAEFISLQELLKRSDIITIHVPYTPETHHMIGEKELQLMKREAYLINTSRGAVVDEKALLEALQSQRIRGAALDVYEVEPPTNWTLMQLPNVVCTPHVGAQTLEAQKATSVMIADKAIGFFSKS